MSDSPLREGAKKWRQELIDFVQPIRGELSDRDDLGPLQDWQRRVTGGLLVQFFEFLEESEPEERYPQLEDHPLHERLFLMISDAPGLCAAEELMDTDSPQAFPIIKEEWHRFLEDPDTTDDEDFTHHYEFWSVWHRNIPENWDVPDLEPGYSYWIHEEGFALADQAGRGAQHLWSWDGEKFELVEEMSSSWVS